MTTRSAVSAAVDVAGNSHAFRSYREVLGHVFEMLDRAPGGAQPSRYWQEELRGIGYMMDASPLVIESLREHCHHLTGIRAYEYREHHGHAKRRFALKRDRLRALDHWGLFVPESATLGGFGFDLGDGLVNLDTLKFYEALLAMAKEDVLPARVGESVVLEIGAGWGGLAYQFKRLFPKTTYVIVDLPEVLLFSGTYLKTVFPEARIHIGAAAPPPDRLRAYDFVLLPHYSIRDLPVAADLDLAINVCSFQEMTREQVTEYVEVLEGLRCRRVYSLNRRHSPNNPAVGVVEDLLAESYEVSEVRVLPEDYTDLTPTPTPIQRGARAVRRAAKSILGRTRSDIGYVHHVGRLRAR